MGAKDRKPDEDERRGDILANKSTCEVYIFEKPRRSRWQPMCMSNDMHEVVLALRLAQFEDLSLAANQRVRMSKSKGVPILEQLRHLRRVVVYAFDSVSHSKSWGFERLPSFDTIMKTPA